MLRYKVFRQAADHSFVEIAHTKYLEDAEAVYERWHSAIIVEGAEIIQSKNLTSPADQTLV